MTNEKMRNMLIIVGVVTVGLVGGGVVYLLMYLLPKIVLSY